LPTIVVGGSHRGAGKTALVCGLISALAEFRWAAVKITTHDHRKPQPIWEETEPGQGTDTARYLAAGAARAFLLSAPDADLPARLAELLTRLTPPVNTILESNRILGYLHPDLCLALQPPNALAAPKSTFSLAVRHADALVAHADANRILEGSPGSKPIFHLAALDHLSPRMIVWVRQRLTA
jgi:hypothetical protein